MIRKGLIVLMLCLAQFASAQALFKARVDTQQIKIGEPLLLQLEARISEDAPYTWPALDSLVGLEIVERSSLDSTFKEETLILKQKLRLTSFDSGAVYIPSLQFESGKARIFSDSIQIRVFFPQVSADQDYFDIKSPREIPINYWKILGYSLAALALLVVIIFLIRKYLVKKELADALPEKFDPRSPVEWALDALSDLEAEKLWQQGKEKRYFSELIDILRHFLERQYGMKAMESTADELIIKLEAKVQDKEVMDELRKALKLSAMVKYARQKALPAENEKALDTIRSFVKQHQKLEANDV